MANWASTSFRIEGNQKDLQELSNLCKAFMNRERPVMEKGASENWEGNIILALGEEIGDSYIRGFIQECELSDGLLSIEAEEAWGATDFTTNDTEGRYFDYRFVVSYCVDDDYDREEFKIKEEALEYAAGKIGRTSTTMDEIEKWNEEHEDNDEYININEYEFVDCPQAKMQSWGHWAG